MDSRRKVTSSVTNYGSSRHYKDACDAGKVEYAAAYRTLVWMMKAKQNKVDWEKKLRDAGYHNIVLVGAGDLCDIIMRELKHTEISICGIVERNIDRYVGKYSQNILKRIDETDTHFYTGKKVVINYMHQYEEWVMLLQKKDVKIQDIVSIEELISYLLLA